MTRLPLVILHVDRENLTALGSEGTFSRRPGRAPHLQPMCSFPLNRGEQCDPLQKQTPSLRASVERAPALQELTLFGKIKPPWRGHWCCRGECALARRPWAGGSLSARLPEPCPGPRSARQVRSM